MKYLRWLFIGTAGVSAAVLLARGAFGPFANVHSPLTAESALAISVIGAWLTAGRTELPRGLTAPHRIAPILVLLAAILAFLPVLSMPLVTDDYIHLRQIADGEAPTPIGCLTNSCGGPHFFRPLGFSTYWAEWELWGTSAMPRHAFDLILHAISSVLFLFLVRRLGVSPPLDWIAGLLFAFGGIRAEAVAWPAARFDTMVLVFSLAAALGALRGGRFGLIVSLAATAAACLSKESGYVLPALLAILLGRRALVGAGRNLVLSNTAVAAAIFLWRWVVLSGIGGYVAQDGSTPTVFQFHAVAMVKTFLWRIWGVLWFPVNWSRPLEWWMRAGLAAGLMASGLLFAATPGRRRVLLGLAGVVVACLPTHHMLLIGPSLERSRYLDLATPAITLLIVFAAATLPKRTGIAALALMTIFQLAALEHDLRIWRDVSKARYELCRELAGRIRATHAGITLRDVPLKVDGVYWRNGIEDCLWLDFGVPMGTVQVNP